MSLLMAGLIFRPSLPSSGAFTTGFRRRAAEVGRIDAGRARDEGRTPLDWAREASQDCRLVDGRSPSPSSPLRAPIARRLVRRGFPSSHPSRLATGNGSL